MRRASRSAFVLATAAVICAGCTFLVSFDDLPAEPDADLPTEAGSRQRDTGAADTAPVPKPDAGADAPPVPVTPGCDTAFPLDQVQGCASFVDNAQVCADNSSITSYPGDRTKDLVTCSKTAGATCVRHCVACARNPSGFPDECDQCTAKSNGKYCGTDMGWQPENFKLLVTCTSGRVASVTPCTSGCDSKGGTGSAACKP